MSRPHSDGRQLRTATPATKRSSSRSRRSKPPIDCFYVYPTVSEQEGPNANLEIEPQETQIAIDQASRFSQDCKVYAPMYRQLTLKAINEPGRRHAAKTRRRPT